MIAIDSRDLTSNEASIVFSNIPQTFTDLVLFVSARTNRASTNDYLNLTLNGSVATELRRTLWGYGSSTATVTLDESYLATNSTNARANTLSNALIHFPNYKLFGKKLAILENAYDGGSPDTGVQAAAVQFALSSPITSITLTPRFGSLILANSSATLYGITAGSDGITTIS